MDQELLARICNAPGVPGYEDEAQAVVMEALRGSCDEVRRDRLGNVIGLKKATQPPADGSPPLKVVLAAHVDEIGMMVKHIDSNGFIRFEPMGGLNAQAIVSQRMVIHGKKPVGAVVVPDTDAAAIQQSRSGALSTTIGAPVRYMHSTVQLCHADDIEATAELLAKFLEHAHELLPDER